MGAGRPGDTPDPCIPESVTQPVHTRQTPVAVFFLLYNLAGCTTPTTRSTPLFGTDDSHEGPRRPTAPTKADEEGEGSPRRGRRKPTKREKGPNDGLASFGPLVSYFLFFFCFFILNQFFYIIFLF